MKKLLTLFLILIISAISLSLYAEIKTRAFDPGDMGQLGTYIAATDDLLIFNNSIEQEYQNLYNAGTLKDKVD